MNDSAPPESANVAAQPTTPGATDVEAPEAPPASEIQPDPPADDATDLIDLDAIERDLDDVQTALERLNDGSYWTDEVTGEPIADDVLAAHPTARTAAPTLG